MNKAYGEIHEALQAAIPHLANPVSLPEGWSWTPWAEAWLGAYLQAWLWAGPEWTEGAKCAGCMVTLQELEMNPEVKARLTLSEARIELAIMSLQDAAL